MNTISISIDLLDDDKRGECPLCDDTHPEHDRFQIVTRPEGDYIVIDGQVCTRWGAPVSANEDAGFYLHENIVRPYDDGMIPNNNFAAWLGNTLFPLKPNVFRPEDVVDLYRAMDFCRHTTPLS